RFLDAVNRERSALPERDVIEIQREDLFLPTPQLQRARHEPLGHLALERLFGCEKRVLDELLGEGAAAAQVFLPADDVVDGGAGNAGRIRAGGVVRWAALGP